MIAACLEAYALTRDEYWQGAARRCFEWFLGRNDLGRAALRFHLPGAAGMPCTRTDVSQNQGAESSLAFYLSLAQMTEAETAARTSTRPRWNQTG